MNGYLFESHLYPKFEFEQDEDEHSRCAAPINGTELVFVTAQYRPVLTYRTIAGTTHMCIIHLLHNAG